MTAVDRVVEAYIPDEPGRGSVAIVTIPAEYNRPESVEVFQRRHSLPGKHAPAGYPRHWYSANDRDRVGRIEASWLELFALGGQVRVLWETDLDAIAEVEAGKLHAATLMATMVAGSAAMTTSADAIEDAATPKVHKITDGFTIGSPTDVAAWKADR